jgi:hypothetical protein
MTTPRHAPPGHCSHCWQPTRARYQDDDGNLVCVPCVRLGVPAEPVVWLLVGPLPRGRTRKFAAGVLRCERIVNGMLRAMRARRAA